MIGLAFVALSDYLTAQRTVVLLIGFRPHHSLVGIAWTAVTALVMFALAAGKLRTGKALKNRPDHITRCSAGLKSRVAKEQCRRGRNAARATVVIEGNERRTTSARCHCAMSSSTLRLC